jgi:predicted nucleic acid-binding protein
MLYLDSSLAVALLVNEPHSERVEAWFAAQSGEDFAVSRWVVTEVAAALSANVRRGDIDTALLQEARTTFATLTGSARQLPIEGRHFDLATRFASVPEAMLRGADALHLAIASEAGVKLCTLDRRQADAAVLLQVPSELV